MRSLERGWLCTQGSTLGEHEPNEEPDRWQASGCKCGDSGRELLPTGSGGQLAGGTAPLSANPAFYLERNSKSISKVAQVTSCTPGLILPFFFFKVHVCVHICIRE